MSEEEYIDDEVVENAPFRRGRGEAWQLARMEERIQEVAADEDEEWEVGSAVDLIAEPPDDPVFPYIIFGFALLKDIFDPIRDAVSAAGIETGILTITVGVTGAVISLTFTLALALWFFLNYSGAWWKRGLIRLIWPRLLIVLVIENLPLISIIPANAILVLFAYHKEKKIVKMFERVLEELHDDKDFGGEFLEDLGDIAFEESETWTRVRGAVFRG